MAITSNVGGALKILTKITANASGALKELNPVHANVSGVLKQIHSAKPTTITGTTSCSASYVLKDIATNISLPTAYTVTFKATIAETPSYSRGARAFIALDAANNETSFTVTNTSDTDMTATAVLPAGVYTFKMLIFNVHGDREGTYYAYPTVTYTITFS